MRAKSVVALFALGAAVAASWWVLFGTSTYTDAQLGEVSVVRRWGRTVEKSMDLNRDGHVDVRTLVEGGWFEDHPHLVPREMWLDADGDGVFEYHARWVSGVLVESQVDDDRDGRYDDTFLGEEAAAVHRQHAAVLSERR